MRIIKGDLAGSQVTIRQPDGVLEIHARLLVAKRYDLTKDLRSIQLLSKEQYHSFEQWIIMIILSLTVVGLLVSVPMYLFAKKLKFTVRVTPKHDDEFIMEGDKADWVMLQRYVS